MILIELLWIFVASMVGAIFHACIKMGKIQAENPQMSAGTVIKLFIKMDWITLVQTAASMVFGIFILRLGVKLLAIGKYVETITYILMGKEILFAFMGYHAQKWFYRAAGTADKFISKKFDSENPTP